MIPIAYNENQGIDGNDFGNYLIQMCKQHRSQGKALAFAFIVYDFENHTIPDILKKRSYWNALHKISGNKLGVFYINSQDSYYKKRQNEIYKDELQKRKKNSQGGTLSFLIPITKKPIPIDNAIDFLKSEFQIDENIKTPFVLFFQLDNEDNLSDYFIVQLKKDKLEDAFLELKTHIKNAVNSLDKVSPENYENHQEIFELIKGELESSQLNRFIAKKKDIIILNISFVIKIFELLSSGVRY